MRGGTPLFVLPATGCTHFRFAALGGQAVLIRFFATRREPRRKELPALRRFLLRGANEKVAGIVGRRSAAPSERRGLAGPRRAICGQQGTRIVVKGGPSLIRRLLPTERWGVTDS